MRSAGSLRAKFGELRREYTESRRNWGTSGQNDPDNFQDFGKTAIQQLYHVLYEEGPAGGLASIGMRVVPKEENSGVGNVGTRKKKNDPLEAVVLLLADKHEQEKKKEENRERQERKRKREEEDSIESLDILGDQMAKLEETIDKTNNDAMRRMFQRRFKVMLDNYEAIISRMETKED